MGQLLRVENIHKSFPRVRVSNKVKLKLCQREIHALSGENGADRSTLIKILGGACTGDDGEIYVNGQRVDIIDVEDTKKYGIRIIRQELTLIPYMTVAENVFLGQEPRTRPETMDMDKMNSEAAKLLAEVGLSLKPMDLVGKLNTAQQQVIEIIRAVSFGAKIIIMGKPTSFLMDTEVEVLFKATRKLKENGVGIIYISRRMSGSDVIADRIIVMCNGEYIDTVVTKEVDHDRLVSLMVGCSLGDLYEKRCHVIDETVLEIEHLLPGEEVRDVTFDLRKGEVLGFSGLIGSGRSEATKCIFGLREKGKRRTYIFGKETKINNVGDVMGYGIGLVSEDRKKEEICAIQGIRFNTTIEVLREFLENKRHDWDRELAPTKEYVDDIMQTEYAGMEQSIRRPSGGNQQKVIISRWLLITKNILILDEPIKGIDIKAKSDIYHLIGRLTAQGLSIILISSKISEPINICDRIVVINQGYTTGVLEREEFSQERIMSLVAIES